MVVVGAATGPAAEDEEPGAGAASEEVPAGAGAPRGRGRLSGRGHGVAEGDEERRRGGAGGQVSFSLSIKSRLGNLDGKEKKGKVKAKLRELDLVLCTMPKKHSFEWLSKIDLHCGLVA